MDFPKMSVFLIVFMVLVSSTPIVLACGNSCGSPGGSGGGGGLGLPPVTLPPVGKLPPVGLPPVTLPPVGKLPPVGLPPVGKLLPPVGLPPVGKLPPVGLPPVGKLLPPVGLPPVGKLLPPVGLPPVVKLPPVGLPPVVVHLPPVTLPPVTVPPVLGKPGCAPAGPKKTCPADTLKLAACVDWLGGLVHLNIGKAKSHCCPLIQGLADVDAALCLCTTIKAQLLNVNVAVPVALEVLVSCGKHPPSGFTCA